MQVGDRFTIYTLNQALTYQVDQITVILPEEIEALAIEPGKDYVTLMTCTPYAVNTHRLLVRGVRVPDDAPTPERRVSRKRSRSMRADCCKTWCCLRRRASCL